MFSDYIFDKALSASLLTLTCFYTVMLSNEAWQERHLSRKSFRLAGKFNHVSKFRTVFHTNDLVHRPNWIKFISSNTASIADTFKLDLSSHHHREYMGINFTENFGHGRNEKIIHESSWEITQRQHELTHWRNILSKLNSNAFRLINFTLHQVELN